MYILNINIIDQSLSYCAIVLHVVLPEKEGNRERENLHDADDMVPLHVLVGVYMGSLK